VVVEGEGKRRGGERPEWAHGCVSAAVSSDSSKLPLYPAQYLGCANALASGYQHIQFQSSQLLNTATRILARAEMTAATIVALAATVDFVISSDTGSPSKTPPSCF
jgi:hypothetical protein